MEFINQREKEISLNPLFFFLPCLSENWPFASCGTCLRLCTCTLLCTKLPISFQQEMDIVFCSSTISLHNFVDMLTWQASLWVYFFFPSSLLNLSYALLFLFSIASFLPSAFSCLKGFQRKLEEESSRKKRGERQREEKRSDSFILLLSLRHKAVLLPFPRGLEHSCCFNQLYTAKIKQTNQVSSWKFPHTHNRKLTLGHKLCMKFAVDHKEQKKIFWPPDVLLQNRSFPSAVTRQKAFTSNMHKQRNNH